MRDVWHCRKGGCRCISQRGRAVRLSLTAEDQVSGVWNHTVKTQERKRKKRTYERSDLRRGGFRVNDMSHVCAPEARSTAALPAVDSLADQKYRNDVKHGG